VVWLAVAFIGPFVVFYLIRRSTRSPGKRLRRSFQSLGVLIGRSFREITNVVGAPKRPVGPARGRILFQWVAVGYHISLKFTTDGICEGVVFESAMR